MLMSGRQDQTIRVNTPSQVCPCSWGDIQANIAFASPSDACSPPANESIYEGTLALVQRGGCNFATKALQMQRAGCTLRPSAANFVDLAVGVIICDNSTGDPVSMDVAGAATQLATFAVVSVNYETASVLKTYANDSSAGYEYRLHTDRCPLAFDTLVSQIAVWSIGVSTCVLASYLSADRERYLANNIPIPYIQSNGVDTEENYGPESDFTAWQALGFTVLASGVLVVLFYFIDQLIIIVIIFYCLGATSSLHHVLCIAGGTCCPSLHRRVYALPLFGEATAVMIFSVFPAAGISSTWFYYRHESWAWVLQDMLSMSLCIQILSLVRVGNMRVTTVLLCMMFVYDNFWVFASKYIFHTSVMVAVATGGGSESLPMLFAFPHACGYSLLGLGDVVVPGLLLALTIRLDYVKGRHPFSCAGYYAFACLGYAIGLAMADVAVILTKIGQPALLYLVPCTLGTTLALAWWRSELAWVWHGVN